MNCATQTFQVTFEQFQQIQEKCHEQGIEIIPGQGQASYRGAIVAYNYNSTTGTLALTCTSKPWPATCGYVNGKLHDLIDEVLVPKQ